MSFQLEIKGGTTLIDEPDRELVAGFEWRVMGTSRGAPYVMTQRGRMYLYLHRLIIGAGPDDVVDHINGDGLDNRRLNLRFASKAQNAANAGKNKRVNGTSSKYKGVSWNAPRNKWQANLHHNGKTRYLGRFDVEEEAARAYDSAAYEIWGGFARLNLKEEVSLP